MRDLASQLNSVSVFEANDLSGDAYVDLSGHSLGALFCGTAANVGTNITVTVYEMADGGTPGGTAGYSLVDDAELILIGSGATLASGVVTKTTDGEFRIGYAGSERYVRFALGETGGLTQTLDARVVAEANVKPASATALTTGAVS